jgi:hypothetical protein
VAWLSFPELRSAAVGFSDGFHACLQLDRMVMPRPVYRWKSFWLGVLVLGFLGWAWAHSFRHFSGGGFRVPGNGSMLLSQSGGTVWLEVRRMPPGLTPYNWQYWSWPSPVKRSFVAPAMKQREDKTGFAHWLVMLLFLVPWVSFLAWRVRKQRRLNA